MQYFKNEGNKVTDVSRSRNHNGYDLVVSNSKEQYTVEVKGCTQEWQIPDLFYTEVDQSSGLLVADFILIVYFLKGKTPFICKVPREAFSPDCFTLKKGYRINSKVKKANFLSQYVQ